MQQALILKVGGLREEMKFKITASHVLRAVGTRTAFFAVTAYSGLATIIRYMHWAP